MKMEDRVEIFVRLVGFFTMSLQWPGWTHASYSPNDDSILQIQFYNLKESKWPSVQEKFKTAASNYLSDYCASNIEMGTCSLDEWQPSYRFAATDVHIYKTSFHHGRLNLTYFIIYPSAVLTSAFVDNVFRKIVPKAALNASLVDNRDKIYTEVGYYVETVNGVIYPLPPDKLVNSIMIPMGGGALLIISVLTLILYNHPKRDINAERREEYHSMKNEATAASSKTEV